jgi:hypothetical protein
MSTRCLAVGAITRDRYGDAIAIGGSSYYAARVFMGLGAAPFVVANDAPEPVFVNEYAEGADRRQWIERGAAPILPDGLPAAWRDVDVMFLCPVLGEVPLAPWLGAVRARWTGMGLQGFLRAPEPAVPGEVRRRVVPAAFEPEPALLARADAVFLSEEDLALAPAGLLDALRASVRLVFLTRGEDGARIFTDAGARDVGVYRTAAVDPTGAGDSFAAACLLALASGADPVDAARLGAAAASIVVEGVAGACLPRIGEAKERAARVPAEQNRRPAG